LVIELEINYSSTRDIQETLTSPHSKSPTLSKRQDKSPSTPLLIYEHHTLFLKLLGAFEKKKIFPHPPKK